MARIEPKKPAKRRKLCLVHNGLPKYSPRISRGKAAPDWAWQLTRRECKRAEAILLWTECSWKASRSFAHDSLSYLHYGERHYTRLPAVRIGTTKDESLDHQKYVLLHEIAHLNVGCSRGHDKRWQQEAVWLYRKHGVLEQGARYGYACERKACQRELDRQARAEARKVSRLLGERDDLEVAA